MLPFHQQPPAIVAFYPATLTAYDLELLVDVADLYHSDSPVLADWLRGLVHTELDRRALLEHGCRHDCDMPILRYSHWPADDMAMALRVVHAWQLSGVRCSRAVARLFDALASAIVCIASTCLSGATA